MLSAINLSTGELNQVATLSGTTQVSAIGYNIKDSYLYGIDKRGDGSFLIKIGCDGETLDVGQLSPDITNDFTIGDVDNNGHGWFTNTQDFNVYEVDLDPTSSTYGMITNRGAAVPPAGNTPGDWAYVPEGGDLLYSITSDTIQTPPANNVLSFSMSTYDWAIVVSYAQVDPNNVFAGADNTIYAEATDGQIYQFSITGSDAPSQPLTSTPILESDGALCIASIATYKHTIENIMEMGQWGW
ncbi:hypothetical protein F5Y18DRAFT_367709 [Xylariaceae sp. FL1019]|nr:hypothetical protein F5Y18DRAFT_367709 [Xylariaceae sp. FL1019]